jgi:hypothetical protein
MAFRFAVALASLVAGVAATNAQRLDISLPVRSFES